MTSTSFVIQVAVADMCVVVSKHILVQLCDIFPSRLVNFLRESPVWGGGSITTNDPVMGSSGPLPESVDRRAKENRFFL